jgi:hypothetical protein
VRVVGPIPNVSWNAKQFSLRFRLLTGPFLPDSLWRQNGGVLTKGVRPPSGQSPLLSCQPDSEAVSL